MFCNSSNLLEDFFGHSTGAFRLATKRKYELSFVHLLQIREFSRIIRSIKIRNRRNSSTFNRCNIVSKRRLFFAVETAEVNLFPILPDVRFPPSGSAVMRDASKLTR